MIYYTEFKGFEYLYLDNKNITSIRITNTSFSLGVRAVALKGHRLYKRPNYKHKSCYRNLIIKFDKVLNLNLELIRVCSKDIQLSIETLYRVEDKFFVKTSFGLIEIESNLPTITYLYRKRRKHCLN